MKNRKPLPNGKSDITHPFTALTLLSTINLQLSTVFAQGLAFTCLGRLNIGANPTPTPTPTAIPPPK